MTVPIVAGYPDWGRYAAQATKKYVDASTVQNVGAPTVNGPFLVGDQHYISFYVTTNAYLSLTFDFLDALSGGVILGSQGIDIPAGGQAGFAIPVEGPVLQVTVNAPVANATYTLRVWSVSGPFVVSRQTARENILLFSDTININAGATLTLNASHVWPGSAFWWVRSTGAVWNARIQTLDSAGATTTIDYMDQASASLPHETYLPLAPLRMSIVNGDAAVKAFLFAIVARPLQPGI